MKKPKKITEERILQISNNVSEEYADHGQTDFATPRELCETIRYWQRKQMEEWEKHSVFLSKIGTLWMQEVTPLKKP